MILKWKFSNLVFIIALIILSIFKVSLADSGEDSRKVYFQNELNKISTILEKGIGGVFFIRSFSRLLPLPNRYVLIDSDESRTEYKSLSGINIAGPNIFGIIIAGKYNESVSEENIIRKGNFIELDMKLEDFSNVKIYKRINGGNPSIQYVFSDGAEYLIITDENTMLWKHLILNSIAW